MDFQIGDKVRLGESVDTVFEVIEFDDDPAIVKVLQVEGRDHPNVHPHWWRASLLRPATDD